MQKGVQDMCIAASCPNPRCSHGAYTIHAKYSVFSNAHPSSHLPPECNLPLTLQLKHSPRPKPSSAPAGRTPSAAGSTSSSPLSTNPHGLLYSPTNSVAPVPVWLMMAWHHAWDRRLTEASQTSLVGLWINHLLLKNP